MLIIRIYRLLAIRPMDKEVRTPFILILFVDPLALDSLSILEDFLFLPVVEVEPAFNIAKPARTFALDPLGEDPLRRGDVRSDMDPSAALRRCALRVGESLLLDLDCRIGVSGTQSVDSVSEESVSDIV